MGKSASQARSGRIPGKRIAKKVSAAPPVNGRKVSSSSAEGNSGSGENGGPSLIRILEGTTSALTRHGAKQLSMMDVCEASGVSRATLYRYFARKEDLLAAHAEFVSGNFMAGIRAAAERESDPRERLRAVMRFTINFTRQVRSDRILEIEPGFVINFLQSHFRQHVQAFNEALAPVFDAIEQRAGFALDRGLIGEMLMRSNESASLIPPSEAWNALPDMLADLIGAMWANGRAKVVPSPPLRQPGKR